MSRQIQRLLSPLARRIRLMASRAMVRLVMDAPGVQKVQVSLLEGEAGDNVDRLQQYGFTSVPHPGAEGVFLSLNGSRDQGVVVVVDDRRFRLKGLSGGEVAVFDDLGHAVILNRDGIRIDGAGHPVRVFNSPHVLADTPLFEVTGNLKVGGGIVAAGSASVGGDVMAAGSVSDLGGSHGSVGDLRNAHNAHLHPENNAPGGNTGLATVRVP